MSVTIAEEKPRTLWAALAAIVVGGLALRLSIWNQVFDRGRILLDSPDGYYHLRRAWMTLEQWPNVPQRDPLLSVPYGGTISWPPLFDGLLATLALPWRSNPEHVLELIGAWLPPVLGLFQIVLIYWLMKSLSTNRAALLSASIVAFLPGSVRYSFLGALDHDPFYECCVLLCLIGLAACRKGGRGLIRCVLLLTAGLSMGVLGWAGANVLIAVIGAAALLMVLSDRNLAGPVGTVVGWAGLASSLIILPFVLSSVWTRAVGATFEGLSLLHQMGMVLLAFEGAILTQFAAASEANPSSRRRSMRILAVGTGLALLYLVPVAASSVIRGMRYAAGDAEILGIVAEARPLLWLSGPFDLRPMVLRLGLLPVFALLLPLALLKRQTRISAVLISIWVAVTLALAMFHSRFSYSAALSLAAAGGLLLEMAMEQYRQGRRAVVTLVVLTLLPALPAYVPVGSWASFNFYLRQPPLKQFEMDAITEWLRSQKSIDPKRDAVMARWSFGHWILWKTRKGVVLSPMLSVGQPGFREGMRFFFLTDPGEILEFLRSHQVRYLIMTPEMGSLRANARIAGIDAEPLYIRDEKIGRETINVPVYMRTVSARLSFWGTRGMTAFGQTYPPLEGLREVAASGAHVPSPFGPVPLVRVYEVEQ